jgi:hypothetical protein
MGKSLTGGFEVDGFYRVKTVPSSFRSHHLKVMEEADRTREGSEKPIASPGQLPWHKQGNHRYREAGRLPDS